MSNSASDIQPPNSQEVLDECSNILATKEFRRSPKISSLLEFLINETLEGRSHYLKAYTIATGLFGKDVSFDPQTDPLVRVNAVRLRRMIQHYYHEQSTLNPVRIELNKGSYIPTFYYTKDAQSQLSKKALSLEDNNPIECTYPSLAVLHFKSLGPDPAHGYIADGFTQEVLTEILKVKSITVISRSTMNLNEDRHINTKRLTDVTDVRYILSGSLHVTDQCMRLYVQLDDTNTNSIIWSKRCEIDFEVDEFISTQREIADRVANYIARPYGVIVQNELRNIQRKTTKNYNAYELYLHYYQWLRTFSSKDHLNAYHSLKGALKIDPNFSDAWASLSIIYVNDYALSYGTINTDEDLLELANHSAIKAIKSDPANPRANYVMLYGKIAKDGIKAYLNEVNLIYQQNKNNSLIIADIGLRLAISGDWERGIDIVEEAMVLNPAHPDYYYFPLALYHFHLGEYEETLRYIKMIDMPEFYWLHINLTATYAKLGNITKAKNHAHTLKRLYPNIENKFVSEFNKWHSEKGLIEKYISALKLAGLNIN